MGANWYVSVSLDIKTATRDCSLSFIYFQLLRRMRTHIRCLWIVWWVKYIYWNCVWMIYKGIQLYCARICFSFQHTRHTIASERPIHFNAIQNGMHVPHWLILSPMSVYLYVQICSRSTSIIVKNHQMEYFNVILLIMLCIAFVI